MRHSLAFAIASLVVALSLNGSVLSQSSTGTISGTIVDQNGAVIPGASVTAKNTATGFARSSITNSNGLYRLVEIPTGAYVVTIDAPNFSKYVQSDITLEASQEAIVNATLRAGNIEADVTVNENASPLNTTTPEVSTRFDSRRLSELPTSPNRSLYNVLLSTPGVSQLANGQAGFALGISFSANGGRIRSNNFMLDGQDINDSALTGGQVPLNNPDAFQEVRIVTGQFLPEHGHNAGSVVNFVQKSGTNDLHGSLFWFHNNENLNACSNTDKRAGFCDPSAPIDAKSKAPLRRENQIGFTAGGPVIFPRFGEGVPYFYTGRDRTFFFVDYQRWSDRKSSSLTLGGVPTAAGREALQMHAGNRPQVQALLQFVPAGIPNGEKATVTMNNDVFDVLLGDLTATSAFRFDSDQGSMRIDHRFNDNNLVYGRYRYSYEHTRGAGQIVPSGHGTVDDRNAHAATIVWTSLLSPAVSNEARIAWKRLDFVRDAENPVAAAIPSVQITELGMSLANESDRRTAFGQANNLPVIRTNDTYQLTEAISVFKGKHSFKFGGDLRRSDERDVLFFGARGGVVYTNLSNFVNDNAQSSSKSWPLPGGDLVQFYRWHEFYVYGQDQWKVLPNLTLSYGIRYEYPGDSFQYLKDLNKRILAANNNDPVFRFEPEPPIDSNNWMPRLGFNWNPKTSDNGFVGSITGGDKLVIRGGYARTYDAHFININQNIFPSFPFSAGLNPTSRIGFAALINATGPDLSAPLMLSRTVVAQDFRSPAMDQISFDVQRELAANLVLRIGYVRTRGTGLFQNVDGNPRPPCPFGTGPGLCNSTAINRVTGASIQPPLPPLRLDPIRGVINIRSNSASSTYDALQVSVDKRLDRGVAFAVHYTWSAFIDTASDVGEGTQDPFNRNMDRARSGYDRPHRLSGNIVFEFPFYRKQNGVLGKLLGGWQVNSFFNFQSGAPFTVLNGSDPAQVGSTGIRPNVFTNSDLSGMTVTEVYLLNQQLIAAAWARAREIFNSLPPANCVSAQWLPGPSLPVTLFSAPRGRMLCSNGQRQLDVVFNGILEGQRVGNAGRNILRADGLKLVDIGVIKNTQLTDSIRVQFWLDSFNAFNSRNFGIPSAAMSSLDFLDKWATDGGSRRIRLGVRLVF